MTDKIVVLSTCGSAEEAEKLAHSLVEQRLAACVNVMPRIRSYYHWKDAIESADECLLIVKSTRDRMEAILASLGKEHSYEVPEVIALPVVDGSPDYLRWLETSLERKPG